MPKRAQAAPKGSRVKSKCSKICFAESDADSLQEDRFFFDAKYYRDHACMKFWNSPFVADHFRHVCEEDIVEVSSWLNDYHSPGFSGAIVPFGRHYMDLWDEENYLNGLLGIDEYEKMEEGLWGDKQLRDHIVTTLGLATPLVVNWNEIVPSWTSELDERKYKSPDTKSESKNDQTVQEALECAIKDCRETDRANLETLSRLRELLALEVESDLQWIETEKSESVVLDWYKTIFVDRTLPNPYNCSDERHIS